MTIRLRGHHLICLHFFRDGPESLKKKVEEVISRALAGEDILVVSGADDVCTSCPWFRDGICRITENAEEEIREMDSKALELLGINVDDKVYWKDLEDKLRTNSEIVKRWYELYCNECDFKNICIERIRQYIKIS